ncbi:spore coat biosynthesis protein F [Actinobacteria bacterium SCGC AG-212-D09]|nr:spore coat biosynthesis protein F [Actinobacteria bacterium SCGC AG-212-D09]
MTSTRLPGKVLEPAAGRPLLEHMIERLRRCAALDGIVVATTTNPSDDPIETLARRLGVGCFRGSEDDVLGRVLGAARAHGAELIVELTGDCPLIDPAIVIEAVARYGDGAVDYCSNTLERTFPRGMDVEVFPVAVLAEVDRLTDDPIDREHVSLYIYEHPERFRLRSVRADPPRGADVRLTVDTPEDLELVRAVFDALYPLDPAFGLTDMLDLLDARPELGELNRAIQQKSVR